MPWLCGWEDELVEGDSDGAAASFLIALRSRRVHENTAHQAGRHREEMRTVLPPNALHVDEAHVGFVDERRRLQAVPIALAGHAPPRYSMQLGVNQRDQLVE